MRSPRVSTALHVRGCQLPEHGPFLNFRPVYLKVGHGWLSCACGCKASPPLRARLTATGFVSEAPLGGRHAWWGFPRGNLKRGERLALRHQSAALFLGPQRKEIRQEGNVSQSALPSGICAKDMPGAFQKEFSLRIEAAPFSPRPRRSAQTPKRGAPGLGQQKPGTPTLLLDESHEIQEVTVTRSGLTTSFPRYPRDPLARSGQTQEEWELDRCRQLKPGVCRAGRESSPCPQHGADKGLGAFVRHQRSKVQKGLPCPSPSSDPLGTSWK